MALETEAFLAGLLHDLGKYAERFQARLDDNSIHGINHWTAGARKAAELKASLVDYAVDGHHTGLPDAGDLRQSLLKMADPILTREHTGCAESVGELTARLVADGVHLPSATARRQEDSFAAALRTRMLFSCLVDADFLDTEKHFDPTAAAQRVVPSIQPQRALGLVQAVLGQSQPMVRSTCSAAGCLPIVSTLPRNRRASLH